MKEIYTIVRRDDTMNEYYFETLAEAVQYCAENELSNEYYRICKILEENGCEVGCLAIYNTNGERE